MKEHETQAQPSSAPAEGDGRMEEGSDPPEEPDQRRQERHTPGLPHEEQIRLVFVGLALLALLVGFLLDRFTGVFLPLFATMVIAYLGYRRLDTWLDRHY
jgi:hypothetical protein